MIIGIPRSRSVDESRVGLPPQSVHSLTEAGAQVVVEHHAGLGSGFTDEQYEAAGARIVHSNEEVFGRADLVMKVTKPEPEEFDLIRPGQVLMSFLHLAVADPRLVDTLLARQATAIDLSCVQDDAGNLPALRPLSQIAGRMVAQIAARYLQTDHGGMGILLGGAPAVPPAEVVVIGAGHVGRNAVRSCIGAGARVTLLDTDHSRITEIDWTFPGQVTTFHATEASLRKVLAYADVVVGAVLIPGTRTPHLVTKDMIGLLRDRSLIIDISVDQGGCFETSRPTRLSDPTYVVDGITHYCVPNLSSLVARSATYALANVNLPYLLEMCCQGVGPALERNRTLARGVAVMGGCVTHPALAAVRPEAFVEVASLLPGGAK